MRTVDEYFARVRELIQGVADAHAERYEEQILSATRANLRIRLRFGDQSLLEISEAIVLVDQEPHWLSYRYHYQTVHTGFVFRYDNAPHHVEVAPTPIINTWETKFWRARILLSSKFCGKLKSFEVRRRDGTSPRILTRPMVAPPGVSAERVKILREAYARSLKDPDLIAEVERQRLDMEPSSGEEIQALIKDLMNQKGEVIERVKKLLEN